MPGQNGHGPGVSDVVRLGDLAPRMRPVEILRDGEVYMLRGYVYNERIPGRIDVQLDSHLNEMRTKTAELVDPPPLDDGADEVAKNTYLIALSRNTTARRLAYMDYLRDVLLTVIVGLEQKEAEELSGDEERTRSLLRQLGYFPQPDEPQPAPEATNESPLTMPPSSPTSAPSAARRRKR